MTSTPRHCEAVIETVIEHHLLGNGYVAVSRAEFDRERAIFPSESSISSRTRNLDSPCWGDFIEIQALGRGCCSCVTASDLCSVLAVHTPVRVRSRAARSRRRPGCARGGVCGIEARSLFAKGGGPAGSRCRVVSVPRWGPEIEVVSRFTTPPGWRDRGDVSVVYLDGLLGTRRRLVFAPLRGCRIDALGRSLCLGGVVETARTVFGTAGPRVCSGRSRSLSAWDGCASTRAGQPVALWGG